MAKEAALKALAIDETVAGAHAVLAFVLEAYEWNWVGAEQEGRRSVALNPADTFARCMYVRLLAGFGRADDAVAEDQRAVDLDPLRADPRFQALLRRLNFPETATPTSWSPFYVHLFY